MSQERITTTSPEGSAEATFPKAQNEKPGVKQRIRASIACNSCRLRRSKVRAPSSTSVRREMNLLCV